MEAPAAGWLGRQTDHVHTLDSTNLYARERAEQGCPEGYTVWADIQTAGKGSHGRAWFSSTPTGLWFSFVLRPQCQPHQGMCLSMLASYSVAMTLRREYGLDVRIKWPNDCYLNGRKTAGILAETEVRDGRIAYMIVGIGINLYTRQFPEELGRTATSIWRESGLSPDRAALLKAILADFELRYRQYQDTWDLSAIREDYNRLLIHYNRPVRITYDGEDRMTVFCTGVAPDGRLLGRKEDGTTVRLMNGEVSVRSCTPA